uniref:Uncharacterized protein n=1 Tax=Anguilla anguilla TaxID=7936 RepID=A0A0E9VXE1_ANGAN
MMVLVQAISRRERFCRLSCSCLFYPHTWFVWVPFSFVSLQLF